MVSLFVFKGPNASAIQRFHCWPKSKIFGFNKMEIPMERASQEEQNGANFSFIAPSSEEL